MSSSFNVTSSCDGVFNPLAVTGYRLRTLSAVIWSIYTVGWLATIFLYFYHRKLPVIRLRSPYLSLISSFGGYAVSAIFLAEQVFRVTWGSWLDYSVDTDIDITGINTIFLVLCYLFFMIMFMIPYPLRALRLLLAFYRQSKQKLQLDYDQASVNHLSSPRSTQPLIQRTYTKIIGSRNSETRYVLSVFLLLIIPICYGLITKQFDISC